MKLKVGTLSLKEYLNLKDLGSEFYPEHRDLSQLGPYYFSSEANLADMIEQVTGVKPANSELITTFMHGCKFIKVTYDSLNKRYHELNPAIRLTEDNVAFFILLPGVLDSNFQCAVAQYIIHHYDTQKGLITAIKGTARAVEVYAAVVEQAKRTYNPAITMGTAISYTKLEHVTPLINVPAPSYYDPKLVSRYVKYLLKRKSGSGADNYYVWRTLPYSHPLGELPVLVFDGVLQSLSHMYLGHDTHLRSTLADHTSWSKYVNLSLNLQ